MFGMEFMMFFLWFLHPVVIINVINDPMWLKNMAHNAILMVGYVCPKPIIFTNPAESTGLNYDSLTIPGMGHQVLSGNCGW